MSDFSLLFFFINVLLGTHGPGQNDPDAMAGVCGHSVAVNTSLNNATGYLWIEKGKKLDFIEPWICESFS